MGGDAVRLLIAQGPAYYGINVRLIDEATYERLLAKTEFGWRPDAPSDEGEFDAVIGAFPDPLPNWPGAPLRYELTTLIMTAPIAELGFITNDNTVSASVGFDTGWWNEGEKALDEVLK